MNKKYLLALMLGLAVLPLVVFGQGGDDMFTPPWNQTVDLVELMKGIIGFVWQFFAGLAVIMFIVAGVQFLSSTGDPAKITAARNAFIWGVVGVIVAIVAFSIVTIIKGVV